MPLRKITIALVLLVFILWSLSILLIPKFYGAPKDPSSFGDMFGGVSALFSGLAFVGLIIAILIQKQELQLQRQDLELTRKELEGQKQQLQIQNETFSKQAFENMLFQILRLQIDIIDSIDLSRSSRYGQNITKGRDCFVTFYIKLKEKYKSGENMAIDQRIKRAVNEFNFETSYELSHYFKNLYRLFEYVDQSKIANKEIYINILKAILSDQEMIILFYYSLGDLIKVEFKELIFKYNIFDDLPQDKLIDKNHMSLLRKV